MAAQFLPIVKAIAPYLAQVATVAIPAFTSKKDSSTPDDVKSDPIVAKQIEELQAASSQNAQSVKVLAEKLQQASQYLESTARDASKNVATYKLIALASIIISVIALAACIYILVR